MDTVWIIVNMVVMFVLLMLLFKMNKKHVSFSKRVFAGLGLGILFGLALHFIYGVDSTITATTTDWFGIIGSGYVKLLQMVAMPLVFISIVAAFTKVVAGKSFGKYAAIILDVLVGTTAVAASVGIASALSVRVM